MRFPALANLFKRKSNSFVGIDIGTSAIKIVELERAWKTGKEGEYIRLNTYGEYNILDFSEDPAEPVPKSTFQMLDSEIAQMIHEILEEAQVRSTAASLSIPVFSSFFTLLELPMMKPKELKEAIPFQARQLVPVPISEVVLDWEVVGRIERKVSERKGGPPPGKLMAVVVAVPRDVIDKYVRIAALAKLELRGLEVETFSLVRSVIQHEKAPLFLIDIGARATNLSIIDEGTIRMSHNLDTSGAEITKAVAQGSRVSIRRAEEFKIEYGLTGEGAELAVSQPIKPILDIIFAEADKLATVYMRKYQRQPQKIILVGGTANLRGIAEYARQKLGREAIIGDPFSEIEHPPLLKAALKELGPSFAAAVGLALREFKR